MRRFSFLITFIFSLSLFAVESSQKVSVSQINYQSQYNSISNQATYVYLLSENLYELNSKTSFKFNPEISYFKENKQQDNKNLEIEFSEMNLVYFGSKITTKVGWIQPTAEGTDLLNPIDYQQPKNYENPLFLKSYSLPSLYFEYSPTSKLTLSAQYVVKNRLSKLPNEQSPWLPRTGELPFQTSGTIAHLPNEVNYKYASNKPEDESYLKNNYILKMKYTSDYFEFLSEYAETIATTPSITPELTGDLIAITPQTEINLTNPVLLNLSWNKIKNYSAGFNIPIGKINSIFKLYSTEQVTQNQISNMTTAAFEKQFDSLILIFENSWRTINTKKNDNTLTDYTNFYKNAQALGIRYAPTEKFSFLLGGIYDSVQKSSVVQLKPKYNFTENFYSELQALIINGPNKSLLSYFEKNDPIALTIGGTF